MPLYAVVRPTAKGALMSMAIRSVPMASEHG
jgi:hypothetical protein